ncbi:unnamed protein product [Spirodela intermedia]|uniref:Glutaredoxin-dependent peroxiredoxin n=1 Tax=Spirodela intermedia TaxID=51605 RepID=A0ABN7E7W0_SPIIN|nr:unnamed protein product [Spirodela intermedia]
MSPAALFAGKKVVMFTLPGAFTPTCSQKHLPGYVESSRAEGEGVDIVACLSVNDAWVMKAWAEQHDALGKIVMLADGSGAFSKALGIELDLNSAHMGRPLQARSSYVRQRRGDQRRDRSARQVRGLERRRLPPQAGLSCRPRCSQAPHR